jgi:8-oxo-dGTP diphosphatase
MHKCTMHQTSPTSVPTHGASDVSRYERPSFTVDVVLLTVHEASVWALFVRRDGPPFEGQWSLPGTFVGIDEEIDAAAERVLGSKAGLTGLFIEQLYTFGRVDRDPRTRVISVAYYALTDYGSLAAAVASALDANRRLMRLSVPWSGETGGQVIALDATGSAQDLAFDHAEILGSAVKRIRGKLGYAPIGFELLPEAFSLRDLRLVHEAILGRDLNKDSFRRRMLDRGLVTPTGRRATAVGHRPPELYRFRQSSAES